MHLVALILFHLAGRAKVLPVVLGWLVAKSANLPGSFALGAKVVPGKPRMPGPVAVWAGHSISSNFTVAEPCVDPTHD